MGRADDAAAHLERAAPVCANVRLLAATLALARGDLDAHERAINRVLAAYGLEPVGRADASAPLSVLNVRASGGQPVEGPLVSVIMAVRDVAPFIDTALGSILDQTWRNLDVIVVDDGSADDTAARIERWAEHDARVRLIRRATSEGPYRARNLGLAQARGEFVTFHDGHDWSHPARIARQVAPLLKDARLVATAAHWFRLDAGGRVSARQVWPLIRWHPASLTFRCETVLGALGIFDEVRAGADCEHWARIRQVFGADRTRILGAPLSLGMAPPDSLTHAPETGFSAGSGNPSRLAYWEAWHVWHARALAAGEVLHLDPARPRPFPAPADLIVPADC